MSDQDIIAFVSGVIGGPALFFGGGALCWAIWFRLGRP
jgi:hypothetical protein